MRNTESSLSRERRSIVWRTNDEDEGGRAKDANRARTTGAAFGGALPFRSVAGPTVERFPRKQKFLLGARIFRGPV